MAPDQPEPDHTPEPTINLVIVDPDALRSAARHLDDLPGADDRAADPPSAADVGDRNLAEEISEFDQQLRAVVSALITDTEGVAAQLGDAAERYRRADDETTSQLVELQEALSRRSDPGCSDEDRDDHDRDDHRAVYEV